MIKIAICDDLPTVAESIKQMLGMHCFPTDISVDTFVSGALLIEQASTRRYDIVLLDIELSLEEAENGIDGMIVANRIKASYPEVIIIFFTGNLGYERNLLNYEPFRYILKPVTAVDVIDAVDAAIRRINNWQDNFFETKTRGITIHINLRNIILFSSVRPHIEVKCVDNDNMTFRGKMDDVEKQISHLTDGFLRPNKSCLLNRKYIMRCTPQDVTMINNEVVSITRKYKKEFMEKLHMLNDIR